MNLFDSFLNTFSAKELGKRAKSVIIFGLIVFAIALIGGYLFLTKNFTLSVTGIGNWTAMNGNVLNVSLGHSDLDKLPSDGKARAEILTIEGWSSPYEVSINEINPANGLVKIELPDFADVPRAGDKFDVRIIISEEPLWRMLLKK